MQRNLFNHLGPVPRLAATILHILDWSGGRMTESALKRRLNYNKHPFWEQAWQLLLGPWLHSRGGTRQPPATDPCLRRDPATAAGTNGEEKAEAPPPADAMVRDQLAEFNLRDGRDGAEESGPPRMYVPGDPLAR